MNVPPEFERLLAERRDAVATGLDIDLIRSLVRALATDGERTTAGQVPDETVWRVIIDPDVANEVAYEFVLATALEELRADGRLELRVSEDAQRTIVAGADMSIALAGPATAPSVLTDETATTVDALYTALRDEFDRAAPAQLDEPPRGELVTSAAATLSNAFASELAASLDAADHLHRHHDITVLTLILAIGARTDHLFSEVRVWAEDAGVAAREQFIDPKDRLVYSGLVETIKIPMGTGHPQNRLRVVDEAFEGCPPEEVCRLLRERFGQSSHCEADRGSSMRERVGRSDRPPVRDR